MPRSYRGIILAIGLVLAAASPPGDRGQGQQQGGHPKTEQALRDIATALQDANKPDHTTKPCPKHKEDRASDLCAQWKAADAAWTSAVWTERTFYLGIGGLVVGFLTLIAAGAAAYFAHKAAVETEKGANAALDAVAETRKANSISQESAAAATKSAHLTERQLEIEETLSRPYLWFEIDENFHYFESLAESKGTKYIRPNLLIRNIGRSDCIVQSVTTQYEPIGDTLVERTRVAGPPERTERVFLPAGGEIVKNQGLASVNIRTDHDAFLFRDGQTFLSFVVTAVFDQVGGARYRQVATFRYRRPATGGIMAGVIEWGGEQGNYIEKVARQ